MREEAKAEAWSRRVEAGWQRWSTRHGIDVQPEDHDGFLRAHREVNEDWSDGFDDAWAACEASVYKRLLDHAQTLSEIADRFERSDPMWASSKLRAEAIRDAVQALRAEPATQLPPRVG